MYEDARFVPAVYVAGYQVQLVASSSTAHDYGQVAYPGNLSTPANGVHDPEPLYLRQLIVGLEEPFDAPDLEEDRPTVGGDGEAQAEQ